MRAGGWFTCFNDLNYTLQLPLYCIHTATTTEALLDKSIMVVEVESHEHELCQCFKHVLCALVYMCNSATVLLLKYYQIRSGYTSTICLLVTALDVSEYTHICTSNYIWRLADLAHLGTLHLRVTCKSAMSSWPCYEYH